MGVAQAGRYQQEWMHLWGLSFSGTSVCWEPGRPGPGTEKGTNAWLRLSNTGMSSQDMSLGARRTGVEGLPLQDPLPVPKGNPPELVLDKPHADPRSRIHRLRVCNIFLFFSLVNKSTLLQHSSPSGTWWWKIVCNVSLSNHKTVSLLTEDKMWGRAL